MASFFLTLFVWVTIISTIHGIHIKTVHNQLNDRSFVDIRDDAVSDIEGVDEMELNGLKCYKKKEQGECMDVKECKTNKKVSGVCSGKNTKCCITGPITFGPNGNLIELVVIDRATVNQGLNFLSSKEQIKRLGDPGCPLSIACFNCGCDATLPLIKNGLVKRTVGPFELRGLAPFVEAVARVFAKIKQDLPDVYEAVSRGGGYCCRSIKRSNGEASGSHSNHSWGMAVDLKIYGQLDKRGDGKSQKGILLMVKYFNEEKLFWGGGYTGKKEDAMHFEASKEAIDAWFPLRM